MERRKVSKCKFFEGLAWSVVAVAGWWLTIYLMMEAAAK